MKGKPGHRAVSRVFNVEARRNTYKGRIENTMETTGVYWGCIGIMEKQRETPVQGLGLGFPKIRGTSLGVGIRRFPLNFS